MTPSESFQRPKRFMLEILHLAVNPLKVCVEAHVLFTKRSCKRDEIGGERQLGLTWIG
jgi:hypothetical protein